MVGHSLPLRLPAVTGIGEDTDILATALNLSLTPIVIDVFMVKISAIVTTYNRAPFKQLERNPLYWFLESLFTQVFKPSEIVLVDDGSTDNTKLVVDHFENKGVIKIKYIKNRKKYGHPKSYKKGVDAASYNLIYCGDDDFILSPYTIWGGVYCITKMSLKDPKAALMLLPFYNRSTIPKSAMPKSNFGNIDLKKGLITANYMSFPLEYLENPKYIDKDRKILAPFKIKNLNYHFVAKKDVLVKIDIPDKYDKLNNYGWETELGMGIIEKGYNSYFTPDPKFFSFHGKYGSLKPKNLNGIDLMKRELLGGINLAKVIAESSRKNLNTGNRVKIEDWYASKIRGFLGIFSSRDMKAARKWAIFTYNHFVIDNNRDFRGDLAVSIKHKRTREKIWEDSIRSEIGDMELNLLKLRV